MGSGRTKVSIIALITRWARTFARRSGDCDSSVIPSAAPSCARRRYGGNVTGGSFRIIRSPPARLFFHILGPDDVAQAVMTPAAKLGADGVLTYPVEV